MLIKVKKENADGVVRLESSGDIMEIIINEDLLSPKGESVSICYRGKSSSGIIELSPQEIRSIYEKTKGRTGLIKEVKRFKSKEEMF